MLTYNMDQRGTLPRYEYLYRCIKEDILLGRIRSGERLPSKRVLAEHLHVAVVTVENAYAQLTAEGYLDAQEKRGYFVNPVEVTGGDGGRKVLREEKACEEQWRIDLKSGGSGTEGFPFSVWAKLMRRVLTEEGELLLKAAPHNGVFQLRCAIARHLYQFRGIAVQPKQIVVGAGTEYLYNLLVQLLGRGCAYGVEDPGYSKAARIYQLSGAKTVPIPVDGQGISPEQVRNTEIDVLHISPNHQFPTGAVTPIVRRQGLLRWAEERKNRYIIEDDYDSEFRFTGRPIPSLQSIDTHDCVLYMNTFSRTLAPSLRIGYMVLPLSLMEAYQEKLGFYSCTVPVIEQYTLAKFLDDGYFESHVNRMRVFYRGRRDEVIETIRSSAIGKRCQIHGEDAGLHFIVSLETGRDDQWLAEQCEKHRIRLSFLSEYGYGPGAAAPHNLVVNYPGISLEYFSQALDFLAGYL